VPLTPEGRKRIAEAQLKRWEKLRKKKTPNVRFLSDRARAGMRRRQLRHLQKVAAAKAALKAKEEQPR
jgi:hypothetical protein